MGEARNAARGDRRHWALFNGGHLAALWAIAVAQPQFDLLRDGQLFVATGWNGTDIVLYSILLVTVPPVLMLLVEALLGRISQGAREIVHLGFVGVLIAIFGGYVLKRLEPFAQAEWFLLPLALGGLGAWAYFRLPPIRSFVSFLAPAPLVLLGLFLLTPAITSFLLPEDSEGEPTAAKPVPVVLLVFDELPTASLMDRRSRLDARSYPNFARLAEDGTWYRYATTPYDQTVTSLTAILTGRHAEGRPPSAHVHRDSLFTMLAGTHELNVHEHFRLCPAVECPRNRPRELPTRITAGARSFLVELTLSSSTPDRLVHLVPKQPPLDPRAIRSAPQGITPRIEGYDELDTAFDSNGSELLFIHTPYMPHQPWFFLPSGKSYSGESCCPRDTFVDAFPVGHASRQGISLLPPDQWPESETRVRQVQQRHLAQVAYADRLVGRVINLLQRKGIYRESLFIAVGDHGISFEPGGTARQLSNENPAEIMGVPLFIKLPNEREGNVSDYHATTIDIVPTIADALKMQVPWPFDGRSLLKPQPDRDNLVIHDTLDSLEEDSVELQTVDFDRRLREIARETDMAFGHDQRGIQLFEFGPAQRLLRRQVGPVDAIDRGQLSYALDRADLLANVDLAEPNVPAMISGRLLGTGAEEVEAVAIEVNGRVAATTWPYDSVDGSIRFAALIGQKPLRPGANEVGVLELTQRGSPASLKRVPAADSASTQPSSG